MGAVFYLGAGWPQWKPLGIPGTHLPLKRGSWLKGKYEGKVEFQEGRREFEEVKVLRVSMKVRWNSKREGGSLKRSRF